MFSKSEVLMNIKCYHPQLGTECTCVMY